MKTKNSKTLANNKIQTTSKPAKSAKLQKEARYNYDDEVNSISELSQSSIIIPLRQLSLDLKLKNKSLTLMSKILFQEITLSRLLFAPTGHLLPALGSRINTQNDFTSCYQPSINPKITLLRKL
ncbi:hypothetical protein F8M41_003826 [Gigaspora margarita]|uniref:Uncharacterized protein n=1 Tax=Gigaspora margarita TaxID=4874 RepID=A0A8H4AY03_GIGMA|nr:hypothetical protein F8M41_003826 [Gigaspora margarita]